MEDDGRTVSVVRLLRVEVTESTLGADDTVPRTPDTAEYVLR